MNAFVNRVVIRILRCRHAQLQGRLERDVESWSIGVWVVRHCLAGVRDGHDDNIMLRKDGALFRIDFDFIFGETPELDAPQTVLPRAVTHALGRRRWTAVVAACRHALSALSGDGSTLLPAWDCLSSVPELNPLLAQASCGWVGL